MEKLQLQTGKLFECAEVQQSRRHKKSAKGLSLAKSWAPCSKIEPAAAVSPIFCSLILASILRGMRTACHDAQQHLERLRWEQKGTLKGG